MISPEICIHIHAYPSRRQRALRALLPKALGLALGSILVLTVFVSA